MTDTNAPPVVILTMGTMRLCIDGAERMLSGRKALAILTYLALQPTGRENRERIAALLWSNSAPDQARAALRQTLRRMKHDLGSDSDLIDADRQTLFLSRDVTLDIAHAIADAAAGKVPEILTETDTDLTRLFVDLEDIDSDFNLWVTVQRERLSTQLVAGLDSALADATDPHARLALADALTRADSTHEGACRAAMQAHLALGDTAQAMRAYERLWQVLEEELDVEPSERTQALYVSIKQGHPAPAPVPEGETDLLAPIAIVVEPTDARHLPETQGYFGTIFRDEMIAALSRFRDWLIMDGQQPGPVPPTYRAYFLRITLHSRDDGILIAMMLIDRSDGRCVWAERQTATLDGMAALHQTALRKLAVALNVHLSTPRLRSARELSSPMGRMYELWMQAQALMGEWRADCEDRAERILRDLIDTHPNFGPAMVALAQVLNSGPIIYPGRHRQPEHLKECIALTSRAVTLDPLDSRAHLSRSWAHAIAGAHSAALSHLDLALDLNENDPWTIISAALGFAFAGEIDRARELVVQTRSFGMRYSRAAQGYVATTLYLCGDYESAVTAAEVAGDAIINLPAWAAACHMARGDPDAAGRAMAIFLELARLDWVAHPRPDDETIIDWFMGCFPIRSDAVRAELRGRLAAAALSTKKAAGQARR